VRPLRLARLPGGAMVVAACLAGCATHPATVPAPAAASAADRWNAPLPGPGRLTELRDWWGQFDDPLMARLVDAAQQASPSIAAARSRMEQSRATRVAAGAAALPALDASMSASRGRQDLSMPLASGGSAGLQASWEIDLFGGLRAGGDAAQARLESAEAGWHDARIAVAAEVANRYTGLRACEARALRTEADARSRAETARLTEDTRRGGFQSPANAALSHASAAQGRADATQQRALCELDVKALVALTGIAEPNLRIALGARQASVPQPARFAVDSVPAQALAQRPDLLAAERDLVAAAADVLQSQAQRLPRISLAGSIAASRLDSGIASSDGTTWRIGPVAVSMPIFDGGTRRANVQAAKARHAEASAAYRGKLRVAVQEVEQALVTLQSTADRSADAQAAAAGFRASFIATEARQRGGLASLFELEDARRSDLQAQTALIELQRERVQAWIALYRSLGGGWASLSTSQATP
jgi:outer membrane protein, multidrug efflux system